MSPRLLHMVQCESLAVLEIGGSAPGNGPGFDLLRELDDVLPALAENRAIAGILLCGAGDDFSPGEDSTEVKKLSASEADRFARLGQSVCRRIETLPKPILGIAQGRTFGTGLELLLACDLLAAAEDAVFGFPGLKEGMLPVFGGIRRLCRRIGQSRAKELLFTGLTIEAAGALRIGLVNRIYGKDSLRREALELLGRICSHGPVALRLAKEIIDAGEGMHPHSAMLLERNAFAACFATADRTEGMTAFLEKRKALFRGE